MNVSQNITSSTAYTNRYKPSKQLVAVTKKRMDEAKMLLSQLESRYQGSRSTVEKKAIQAKVDALRGEYEKLVQQMQIHQESQGQNLPHPPNMQVPCDHGEDQQPSQSQLYMPTQHSAVQHDHEHDAQGELADRCCAQNRFKVVAKESADVSNWLDRKTHQHATGDCTNCEACKVARWSELQKQKVREMAIAEEEANKIRVQRENEFKGALVGQVLQKDFQKTHKAEIHKTRPKSPLIYDSSFGMVGQTDIQRARDAPQMKAEYNDVLLQQTQEDSIRKRTIKAEKREGIDMSTGILPIDRLDENGKIKTWAIPDHFIVGKEFSNQAKVLAEKADVLNSHIEKENTELAEIRVEDALTQARLDRDATVVQSRNDKIGKYQTATDYAIERQKHTHGQKLKSRYGSIQNYDADAIVHGHVYSTVNRRVHPQPDPKLELIYGDGNFIQRIDDGDRLRRGNKAMVLPLTDDEMKSQTYKHFILKNPHKKELDEADINMIRNYIQHHQERVDGYFQKLDDQHQYDEELRDHESKRKAQDMDCLDERDMITNGGTVKSFVKPLI